MKILKETVTEIITGIRNNEFNEYMYCKILDTYYAKKLNESDELAISVHLFKINLIVKRFDLGRVSKKQLNAEIKLHFTGIREILFTKVEKRYGL